MAQKWVKQADGTFKAAGTSKKWKKKQDGTFEEVQDSSYSSAGVNNVTRNQNVQTVTGSGLTQEQARLAAQENILKKYGTYEQFQKSNSNSHAKTPDMQKLNTTMGRAAYDRLIEEETNRLMSGSDFYGLTNKTYQEYLDNLKGKATEQKQIDWVDRQKKNLEAMSKDSNNKYAGKNTREWVIQYVDSGKNILEYMGRHDAEYALKKLGYSEEDIKSMADTYKREQNAAENERMMKNADEMTDNGVLGKTRAQLLSIGAGITSAVSGLSSAKNAAKEILTGEYSPLDTNNYFYTSGDFRDRARQNIEQDITGSDEYAENGKNVPAWREALGMLYQGGSSFVDSTLLNLGLGPAAAMAVMGSQAAGSTSKEVFERTGSNEKAMATGTASGIIEAITEKMGLDNIWDIIKGSGKAAARSALVNILAQSTIEGIEELTSEGLNIFADWLINRADSDLEQNVQNYKESGLTEKDAWNAALLDAVKQAGKSGIVGAISGAMGGGMASAMQVNLSDNAQKVVDAEVESRIAEKEQDGKKVKAKEKAEIREQVEADLRKGYISIDTIESTLGGETYNSYKSVSEQEDALTKEFDALNKMKQGEMTGEQIDRRTELKSKLEELKKTSNKTQLKEKLSREVSELAGNDLFLRESYNEKTRRSQAFEADLSQYDKKQQAVVQKAMDSGILNNTNRTHEFVDLIAKIAADKGVSFDFTNNENLKNSGFAIEGKSVNGFVKDGTITLNIQSNKALNTVVGHEITHILEGTELYGSLQEAVFAYAKTNGEYDSRLESVTKLYENIKGANIEKELTADLIGDYIFTDEAFIRNLSANNQNLFQKMFNEVKYLVKSATAGSTEEKQLLKVKKLFEDAYRENISAKERDGIVKFSLGVEQYLDSYSEHQKENWKNSKKIVLFENETQLRDFVEKAKNRENAGKKLYFGIVKDEVAERVKNEVGYDIRGYNCALYSDNIRKIFKDHGNESKEITRGQSAVEVDDFSRIPEVICEADSIEDAGMYMGNPAIKFKKDGVTVIGIATDGALDLYTQTMYVGKKNRSLATAIDELAPINTPETTRSTASNASILQNKENATGNSKNNGSTYSLSEIPLNERVTGDALLDAEDLISEIEDVAEVSPNGYVALYHRTTKENAKKIMDTGKMSAKEDGIFFSTKKNSQYTDGYGDSVVEFKIPVEKLVLDDIFDDEAHLRLPLKNRNQILDVSNYIVKGTSENGIDFSLSSKNNDIAPTKGWSVYGKDIALEKDIAPVRKDINAAQKSTAQNSVVAPVRTDIKRTDTGDIAPVFDNYNKNNTASDDIAPVRTDAEQVPKSVKEVNRIKRESYRIEIERTKKEMEQTHRDYNEDIGEAQAKYDKLKNKNTNEARKLLSRINRKKTLRDNADAKYEYRINKLQEKINKMGTKEFKISEQRMEKQNGYREQMRELIGDTSTWVDKKLGLSYQVNTLKRNLRDIVRTKDGNRDIARADAIYDELQGKYNHNEALLNRESNSIKEKYRNLKITKSEDAYIQMLGEYRHNPDCTLTPDQIKKFYEEHKKDIDTAKVDRIIEEARKDYDSLYQRVNGVLRDQGMKEFGYREGYFPHFTEEKQGWLGKLFNWKVNSNNIPTDIAGITENFNPDRSWQSFNKKRTGDVTDYSFMKGMDTYVQGALDWIYHIEDIQKRRAFENEIRYRHSEKGVQEKIDKIFNDTELDADEVQQQIDAVYAEAKNPMNNFITDFRNATNNLAGKKSTADRGLEYATNRKIYSIMTNVSNRVSANMVAGSVSSALTNFIPITQSWGAVNPVRTLEAMSKTIQNYVKDDGIVDKSDFLTNRLKKSENLYQSGWDKAGKAAGLMMECIDNFTSHVVWRSKYIDDLKSGMSESDAIKNADNFAEGLMAGRSRGNMPTIFNSKNPVTKVFTAFQLEVNNQYGYMFKDMPQDIGGKSKFALTKGYASMFIGAYLYNALYSSLTGRDSAFDPIGIIEELLRDLGVIGDDDDKEKEPLEIAGNLAENIAQEIPFLGGLIGGGRVPISSALPYGNPLEMVKGSAVSISEGEWKELTNEWLKPVYYLAMPMGGGQLRKSVQGLSMFDKDLPVSGSYTNSGQLRFPVDDTMKNRIQAGIFGQYASKNARDYFDNNRKPLNEKQISEYKELDIPIQDYWDYKEELKKLDTLDEKADYISNLDLPVSKKNTLINNIANRNEPIDLTDYEMYSGWEEFDYAQKNPEKYSVAKAAGGYEKYTTYSKTLNNIQADKDKDGKPVSGSRKSKVINFINGMDAEYGEKIILFKSQYPSDNTYNQEIVDYLNSREDITYKDMETILKELGFTVEADGTVRW